MKTNANTSKDSPPPQVRLCLSDNDWVAKLAAFDLLKEVVKRIKVKRENIRILGTCEAVVCGTRLRKEYGASMVNAAKEFINSVTILEDDAIDDGDFIRLTDAGIDGGEAQLFASKLEGFCIIATDDKRAMMRLATIPTLADIHKRTVGRVLCVEHAILMVAEVYGYAYVDERIRNISWADDKVLQVWAGGKGQQPKEALKLIRSHIDDLNRSTNGLMFDPSRGL
jgi:hypothetical protein